MCWQGYRALILKQCCIQESGGVFKKSSNTWLPPKYSDLFDIDFQNHAYDLASSREISSGMCYIISNIQRDIRYNIRLLNVNLMDEQVVLTKV